MVWSPNPIIVSIGPFALRWYSLFFALGFLVGYVIAARIFEREGRDARLVDSLLIWLVVATIVGARLGQVLFYEPRYFLDHPGEILQVWHGGLASHGGFTAVLLALVLFSRRHRDTPFLWLTDRLSIPIMFAAGCIRIGNFFNSEIIGRPTSVPWAVVFARVDRLPRHPTQIYEALGYFGTSLVLYLWYRYKQRRPPDGQLLGMAMLLGFGWRFAMEFLKENQELFEASLPLNMGQLLSIPFLVIGLYLVFRPRTSRTGR
jgi:phosphatidylglycerol:prolipoprotein diacylglycerol transferase